VWQGENLNSRGMAKSEFHLGVSGISLENIIQLGN
jgi:hypothetical protein